MKKWLAVFLLLLLPLQVSWAAVASYCGHEIQASAQQHLGHHSHAHLVADDDNSPQNSNPSSGVHHDCATCHLGNATVLTTVLNAPQSHAGHRHLFEYLAPLSQAPSYRLERPQWPALA